MMTVRMTALALTAFGIVALQAPLAQAQRISPMQAGNFARFCSTPSNGGQKICDAYITGMADSFALAKALSAGGDGQGKVVQAMCVPTSVSGDAMRSAVVSWMSSHRDKLHSKVSEVVFTALHESYPCDASKSGG